MNSEGLETRSCSKSQAPGDELLCQFLKPIGGLGPGLDPPGCPSSLAAPGDVSSSVPPDPLGGLGCGLDSPSGSPEGCQSVPNQMTCVVSEDRSQPYIATPRSGSKLWFRPAPKRTQW